MGLCITLLILAWGWIRLYSVAAAVAMSAVAAIIPPFAAVVSNVDSPILREDEERRGDGDGDDWRGRMPGA
jgi:hypothetical protein